MSSRPVQSAIIRNQHDILADSLDTGQQILHNHRELTIKSIKFALATTIVTHASLLSENLFKRGFDVSEPIEKVSMADFKLHFHDIITSAPRFGDGDVITNAELMAEFDAIPDDFNVVDCIQTFAFDEAPMINGANILLSFAYQTGSVVPLPSSEQRTSAATAPAPAPVAALPATTTINPSLPLPQSNRTRYVSGALAPEVGMVPKWECIHCLNIRREYNDMTFHYRSIHGYLKDEEPMDQTPQVWMLAKPSRR